ncbi:MAG TPA: hypothetical protein VF692_10170, partial [Pyrinomonadaceae bacterium]
MTKSLTFASDKNSDFYVLSDEALIYSINALTGQTNWTYEVGAESISNIIAAEDGVFVANVVASNRIDNKDDKDDKDGKVKRIHLRSLNRTSGIPFWLTEIVLANETKKNQFEKFGEEDASKIFLGQSENSIFLSDTRGNYALAKKRQGNLEAVTKFEWAPNSFFDFGNYKHRDFQTLRALFGYAARNKFYLIAVQTGKILNQTVHTEIITAALLEHRNLFIGDEKGGISLFNIQEFNIQEDGASASLAWNIKTGGKISSLSLTGEGILAASFDNFAYLIDRNNGKRIWKKRLPGRLLFKPLIVENEKLFVIVENNAAYFVGLQNGRILSQITLPDGEYFVNPPVLLNGR